MVVAVLVTLGVFVAAAVGYPLVHGGRWLVVAVRSLVLLVLNAWVLLTASIVCNDYYGLCSDWTDRGNSLFGAGPGQIMANGPRAIGREVLL
jgi:hypothetical protein